MKKRTPISVKLSDTYEPPDSPYLDIEYHNTNSNEKDDTTTITIRADVGVGAYPLEILNYGTSDSGDYITFTFSGAIESGDFLRGLALILETHKLVEKIDG
jgi:hypothetical protein